MPVAKRTFASDLDQLAEMRSFLEAACREAWVVEPDDDALCQLELAVHEAAVNIIRHTYGGQAGNPIVMTIETSPQGARVSLRHEGPEFSPASVPLPRFDGSQFGGFGVYLIQQLVDEVYYDTDAEGRSGIRLVKHRKAAPEVDTHATVG